LPSFLGLASPDEEPLCCWPGSLCAPLPPLTIPQWRAPARPGGDLPPRAGARPQPGGLLRRVARLDAEPPPPGARLRGLSCVLLPRSGARTPPRACCARCEQFPALRARRGASPLWLRDALDRRDADSLRRFCVPLRLCVPALARKFRPAAWPLRPGVASPFPPIAPALSSLFRRPGAVRPRPWPARAHA